MFIESLEGRQMFSVTAAFDIEATLNVGSQSSGSGAQKVTVTANGVSAGEKLSSITKKIADTAQAIEQNVK